MHVQGFIVADDGTKVLCNHTTKRAKDVTVVHSWDAAVSSVNLLHNKVVAVLFVRSRSSVDAGRSVAEQLGAPNLMPDCGHS